MLERKKDDLEMQLNEVKLLVVI